MMMGGLAPFMMLAGIGTPTIVIPGIAVGLAARRWWHLIPGLAVPPAVYWSFYRLDYFLETLPFVLLSAAIWIVASHAAKRAWTR
jgi:hypothetical protein